MDKQDIADRLEAVGRPDLAKRYKHLSGKHDQRTHGWRYAKGGSDADRLHAARRSMRGSSAEQRATYRKRAGMPEARPLERKQPQKEEADEFELRGNKIRHVENKYMSINGKRADMSPLKKANEATRASVFYTIENALEQGRSGPLYKKIEFYKSSARDHKAKYDTMAGWPDADVMRRRAKEDWESAQAAQTVLENLLQIFP